jgi:hypothetical protein
MEVRMPLEPEQIKVGKTYLTVKGQVLRVVAHKGAIVTFETRATGKIEESSEKVFARMVETEVAR